MAKKKQIELNDELDSNEITDATEIINATEQSNIEKTEQPVKIVEKIIEVEKIVEKIIEKPVEKIVEKIVYKTVDSNFKQSFQIGDYVYLPNKYQRMRFEIRKITGISEEMALYRLLCHDTGIVENYVRDDEIVKA
jgi:hypothetical protein